MNVKLFRILPIFMLLLTILVASVAHGQSDRDKAVDLFRSGKYAESIGLFEELVRQGETDYPTATYLGASYVKLGMTDKAIKIFGKATSLGRPTSPLKYDKKFELTNNPKASFSDRAMGNDRQGLIRLAVELRSDKKIGFVFPYATSSERLVEEAVKTARNIKFKPAIINGNPVTVVILFDYSFYR